MRIALAQINPIVGDITGNLAKIVLQIEAARNAGCALVLVPELAVTGYPPKDLLLRREFIQRSVAALDDIASACHDITAVVGYVAPTPDGAGTGIANAAVVCTDRQITATYAKCLLPTYDVFDESRYFTPGRDVCVVDIPDHGSTLAVGITICEDLWNDEQFGGRPVYGVDPIERTVRAGAKLVVNISASPFTAAKNAERVRLFSRQVRELGVPLAYCGQVGGNDDLIFDGGSMVLDHTGQLIARARPFDEDRLIVDLDTPGANRIEPYPEGIEGVFHALVLGTRDYVRKCGFRDVVLGLSGGIDSAVTAVIAVEALGAAHVHGVAMPSRFSSDHSIQDADAVVKALDIGYRVIPIRTVHAAMEDVLADSFAETTPDITEENIQARIRGALLMALSNKFGWLCLTTGNKSELAVGYCTLYGDMCGGLAPLSDVPKTAVYELARFMNTRAGREVIPRRTIDKPPSAELRDNQTDQDSLPPYPLLDGILARYVERDESIDDIIAAGFDADWVRKITAWVDRNEYKRRQSALGLKVTSKAFGTGRRLPIAARYH